MVPRGYSYAASSYEKEKRQGWKKPMRKQSREQSSGRLAKTYNNRGSIEKDGWQMSLHTEDGKPNVPGRSNTSDQKVRGEHDSSKSEPLCRNTIIPKSNHSPVVIEKQAISYRSIHNTQPRSPHRKPVSSSSPQSWGMLLTPPEETEAEFGSIGSDTTLDGSSFVRSMSKDSMTSIDDESISSLSTESPEERRMNSIGDEKRQLWVSTSLPEDCRADHPLLSPIVEAKLDLDTVEDKRQAPLATARLSKFKSNLTASLRAISSAAKSFSNLAAPAVRQDEYLTRSLLSISSQLTDERRPILTNHFPDPALRRYLNPTPSRMSAAEFYACRSETRHAEESLRPLKASVQLQPYSRRPSASEVATSPPIFMASPAVSSLDEPRVTTTIAPRQREPRENSDFLRVIVLEMNMRRNGRLKDAEPGRARLWLPARQSCDVISKKEEEGNGQVPRRWVGIVA